VDIGNTFNNARRLAQENKTSLLTAVGVVGTVSTAVMTGRASFKAAQIIEQETNGLVIDLDNPEAEFVTQEKIKLVWTLYIPPVGVGALTIAAIVMAHRIDAKQAAALATAYGVSERAFSEYKEKVVEKLGEKKEQAIRDEIAQDRVKNDPVQDKQVIIAGNGDVLCYDNISGRYFQSSVESIRKAENTVNYEIIHFNHASLSKFYEEIGLPPTRHSDEVGWNSNNLLEIVFSTTMSTDDRPCIVMDFQVGPIQEYANLY
jgi:hypothetical protein